MLRVAVLLERDLREQCHDERERDHDDRDDLDQLRSVRLVDLERNGQDVTQAALGDRATAARAWRRRWWWCAETA